MIVNFIKIISTKEWFNYLKKPEYIFIAITSVFGIISIFLIPPGWNSDEYQHFFRVEQLADGTLFAVNENGEKNNFVGGFVDREAVEFIGRYGFENEESRENPPSPLQMWREGGRRTSSEDKVYVPFNGSAVYPPLTYMPQIIGITVGKILNLPIYGSFILARLSGLIFYIVIVFISIRLLPRGKWVLLAISILATSIVQAAALGADAVTFSVVVLFIAYTLNLASTRGQINFKKLLVLGLIMTCMGLVKPTYIALLPLTGLLFLEKKNRNKNVILAVGTGVLLSILLTVIWVKLTSYVGTNGGPESDKILQLRHVLGNPFEYLTTIVRTYFGVTPGGYWNKFYEVAFTNYVWDTSKISFGYSVLTVMALAVSLGISDKLRTSKHKASNLWENTLMVGSFFITFLLINTAIYVYFTPVGNNVVVGVQARYIFPFLVLLLLPFQNVYKNQKFAKITMISIMTLVLLASFIGIYKTIYIT